MPKEVKELKVFMSHLAGEMTKTSEDKKPKEGVNRPKSVFKKTLTVKRNQKITKFKLRTSRYLYTFKTADGKIIKTILNNLPSQIKKVEVKNKSGRKIGKATKN
jgi:hypothetical protein